MKARKPITERTRTIERGCDCDCANHETAMAPVYVLVLRDGKELRLCSRCDLSTDIKLARLVSKAMPAKPFFDFDDMGAFCIPLLFESLPVEADYRKSVKK